MTDFILVLFFTTSFFMCFYFGLWRNTNVLFFLKSVSMICYERQLEFINGSVTPKDYDCFRTWIQEINAIDAIVDDIRSVSYAKLLFSFKPLEIENWFTEEQVKFLRGETHRPEDFYVGGTNIDMTTL